MPEDFLQQFDGVEPELPVFDAVADPAVFAISYIIRHHGYPADDGQIRMHLLDPSRRADLDMILRALSKVSLKAKAIDVDRKRFPRRSYPLLAQLRDGSFIVVTGVHSGGRGLMIVDQQGERLLRFENFDQMWTGTVILIAKLSRISKAVGKFGLSWFFPYLRKYSPMIKQVLLASLCIQLMALITPFFFREVVDKALVHKSISTLEVLVLGLGVVSIYEVLLEMFRTYLFSHTTNRIDVELGSKLYRHLLSLPLGFFKSRQVGETIARVRELESIRHFMTGSGLTSVVDLLFTVVFLSAMWYFSPRLTFVVILALPLFSAVALIVLPLLFRRMEEKFDCGADAQSQLIESVRGIETIKSMAVEKQFKERWRDDLAEYLRVGFSADKLGIVAGQSIQLINKLITVATLFLGAREVLAGTLSVGALVAFNMLTGRVTAPILRLSQLWQDFQQAKVSIRRLGDIMDEATEPVYNPNRMTMGKVEGRVQFLGVSFRYRPDLPETLRRVTIEIEAGQTVGVVGSSGSGKSTLTKLIQRLYYPESGRVLVDGIDLSMVDVTWLRGQIGVVLQENVLFSRSIRENIAITDPSLPLSKIVEAAELAGAHDFIQSLEDGYDTVLSERGANLSGGQRQRIAIARALVTNPRILILDEATSALDYESEHIIQKNLARICEGRTVIIIAHRLSTISIADRIITIEKGEVVEDGTHEELLELNGRYAHLWQMQSKRKTSWEKGSSQ